MITRTLKLKLTKDQESILNEWLYHLTYVYNWAICKIGHDAEQHIYYSLFDFQNSLAGCSKRMGISSHVLAGILRQAYTTWIRCFKKISGPPRLKGRRNKLNSIPFPDPIEFPMGNRIKLRGWRDGIKFHKQKLPKSKIKCGRIIKKASGWYLVLFLDCDHKFPVKETTKSVGIDPGFKTLLTLSDGIKIENPRELRNGEKRLSQAQRGNNLRLSARLHERQANRRRDRNHKISRWLVENYGTICYSDDHFKGMAKHFGKSVTEAGLGQLIAMLDYKSRTGGRKLVAIDSKFTTMTCSACGARTGPHGRSGLAVRHWKCSACGAVHDRDVNSAQVVLSVGAGIAHEKLPSAKMELSEIC